MFLRASFFLLAAALLCRPAGAQIADLVTDGPELVPGKLVKGEMEPSDPKIFSDKSPFKAFRLKLEDQLTYQITYHAELVDGVPEFDPLLLLFNTRGRLINLNDDYTEDGQNLDSRLVFRAEQDEVVIVYANAVMEDAAGRFTLLVEIIESDTDSSSSASQP